MNSLVDELQCYGKALRGKDSIIYARLLKKAYKHFGTTSYANSMHAWAFLLLSIMLEQEKKLQELEDGIRILEDKIPGGNNNGEGEAGDGPSGLPIRFSAENRPKPLLLLPKKVQHI